MEKDELPSRDQAELRRRAEERLAKKKAEAGSPLTEEESRRLLHELQVHQVELELQNVELRQARAEMEASLERYTDLYDFAPVGYLTLDGQGAVREVNLAGASLLGEVRSRLLGQLFTCFLSADSLPLFKDFLAQVREGKAKQSCQVTLARQGQGPRHLHIEAALVDCPKESGLEGEGICRLAVLDITERKRLEEEKAEVEIQLRQAQKMEAIGTLAGGIAHDFNNILAAIMGYAEVVRDDVKDGIANTQDLDRIIASTVRARDLVNQILTFSRKTVASLKPISLNQRVSNMVGMLTSAITNKISIEQMLALEPLVIIGDATKLEQVIINLATNARDAMPEGGRIIFETRRVFLDEEFCRKNIEVTPGPYAMLTVTDDGHGMDQQTLEHMYDPFFTTKDVGKGTGLGLSTVHGIVKIHAGHIFCASQPGKGTSFTIYLPVIHNGTP